MDRFSILVEISPVRTRRPLSTRPIPRCWAAPGWTGPSTRRRGRSCWRSAGRWGAASGGRQADGGLPPAGRYVIHTPGPVWQGGEQGEAALLASCYRSCLLLAEAHSIRTPGLLLHIHGSLRVSVAAGGHRGPAGHHGASWRTMPCRSGCGWSAIRSRRRRSTAGPGTSGTRRARTSGCKERRSGTFPAPAFVTLRFFCHSF